jgi:N-acetylmuramoyl-L-alanine amidase
MSARGFSAYTSKGNTKSDPIAELIINDFIHYFPDIKVRTDKSDGDKDWEENFTVLMGRYI